MSVAHAAGIWRRGVAHGRWQRRAAGAVGRASCDQRKIIHHELFIDGCRLPCHPQAPSSERRARRRAPSMGRTSLARQRSGQQLGPCAAVQRAGDPLAAAPSRPGLQGRPRPPRQPHQQHGRRHRAGAAGCRPHPHRRQAPRRARPAGDAPHPRSRRRLCHRRQDRPAIARHHPGRLHGHRARRAAP